MYGMFNGAYKFEGKGLENWKTDSLVISQWMFYGDEPGSNNGYQFDADLSGWDMSKVTNFWEVCYNVYRKLEFASRIIAHVLCSLMSFYICPIARCSPTLDHSKA